MLHRAFPCLLILFAVLAAPSGAVAADTVLPSSVSTGTTVPAGGARTLTARCPSQAVALSGAVTQQGAGLTLRRSAPGSHPGAWTFRFAAEEGARRRGARVVIRCVRLGVTPGTSGARLEVSTRRQSRIAVASGETTRVEVRCRRGWAGTGYAVNGGSRGDVKVASVVPTARGWDVVLENAGTGTARASVIARCLKRAVTAGSQRLEFRVDRREFSDRVGPGRSGAVSHRCGSSGFSLAAGSEVDPLTAIELAESHPEGDRVGRWLFRRAARGDRVTTHLVCLDRRTRFR